MTLSMLTADELTQFDTGFGEPDGATVDLSITGIARLPPGVAGDGTPLLASSAFAAAHPESVAGGDLFGAVDRCGCGRCGGSCIC
jgi:hypothetical protein